MGGFKSGVPWGKNNSLLPLLLYYSCVLRPTSSIKWCNTFLKKFSHIYKQCCVIKGWLKYLADLKKIRLIYVVLVLNVVSLFRKGLYLNCKLLINIVLYYCQSTVYLWKIEPRKSEDLLKVTEFGQEWKQRRIYLIERGIGDVLYACTIYWLLFFMFWINCS